MQSFLNWFLPIIVVFQAATAVRVIEITPRKAGTAGGAQIHIYGEEFSTTLNARGAPPNQQVIFVSSLAEYDCNIHVAENDENQVVCYTNPMQTGTYYMRMKDNGRWLETTEYCGRRLTSSRCRLQISDGNTPTVTSLSWTTGEPRQLLNVTGKIITNLISSSEGEATNGNTNAITRVYVTSGTCELYDPNTQLPYGIQLEGSEGQEQEGTFTCFVKNQFVGNQNLSYIVDGEFGRSKPELNDLLISADNRIYMLQTYAVITDVSPKVGSIAGGTLLTISGRSFDDLPGAVQVYVGGEPCIIKTVDSTTIKCQTPEKVASRTWYSGGRGLKVEIYPGLTNILEDLDPTADNVGTFFTDNSHVENDMLPGDRFLSRIRGFFVPSLDANYVFTIHPDDHMELYFNPIPRNSTTASPVVYSYNSNQKRNSGIFPLISGEEYYFELRHVEYSGPAYSRLSVHIDQTNYSPSDTSSAVSEKQTIRISSTIDRETQVFSLEDWTEQTPVQSVWTASLVCQNETVGCSGLYFYFTLFETNSDTIMYGSSAAEVESTINRLVVLHEDSTSVTSTDASEYVITFHSTRGRMPLLGSSSDNNRLTVVMSESSVGIPKLDTITFQINGLASPPVAHNASEEEVARAIMTIYSPTCPDNIGRGLGIIKQYYDMEDFMRITGILTSERSFCGSYSIKNPWFIYYNDNAPIRLNIYKHICFAYFGGIRDLIYLYYTYTRNIDNGGTEEITTFVYLSQLGLSASTEWIHFCYDFNNRLASHHQDGRNFMVRRVHVYRYSELFLDNIFFGSTSLTDAEREAALIGIVPPAVPHIRLSRVEVTKNAMEYTIKYFPLDCGNEFPLISPAFSSAKNESANSAQYGFNGTTSKVRVLRVEAASPPVSGTFDIQFADPTYRGLTDLSASMTAEELKNNIESLSQIDLAAVRRYGSCFGYSWEVTFNLPGGNYPTMYPNGTNLISAPNDATMTHSTNQQGGLLIEGIGGDFFRIANDVPQVQVFVNGVPSSCVAEFDDDNQTSCNFEWVSSSTPQVTSVSPQNGPSGTSIVIYGNMFSSIASGNTVLIGGVACYVTDSAASSINCTVGSSPGGNQPLSVNVEGLGFAEVSDGFATFQVTGAVSNISPPSGSVYGCTTVTITGSAFDDSSTVEIGGSGCNISHVTYDSITCQTTANSIGPASVEVSTAGVTFSTSVSYQYTSSGIGNITSLSTTTLSVVGEETLIISGTGFGTQEGSIYFGSTLLTNVTSWTDTAIEVVTPSLEAGSYDVILNVKNIGCAEGSQSVRYEFTITSISPTSGSIMGGTNVTITGSGLINNMNISFGHVKCDIDTVNSAGTQLTCKTRPATTTYVITNGGRHPSHGIGYAWKPSVLNLVAGDRVSFSWSVPPQITGVTIGLFTTRDIFNTTYDGNGFEVPPAQSGRKSVTFNNVGTVHFASGCVGSGCSVFMRGALHIGQAQTLAKELSVSINEIEAIYNPSAFSFTFDTSLTPTVTRISPRTGNTETLITIEGTGFDTKPSVTVGGKLCEVQDFNLTSISWKVPASEGLATNLRHEVEVSVPLKGLARKEIPNSLERTLVLLPLVTSVAPSIGSIAGGTTVTIKGSGFDNTAAVVINELTTCKIVVGSTTYDTITCVTNNAPITDEWSSVGVTIGQTPVDCFTTCEFLYSSEATPNITFWNTSGVWENLEFNFFGSGFGNVEGDISVFLHSGDIQKECTISHATDQTIRCNIDRFAVGTNMISVSIAGKGLAQFMDFTNQIVSPSTIDHVNPGNGSINGGTVLTISGNGFVDGMTTVAIGNVDCPISAIDLSSIVCTTGNLVPAGVRDIQVMSNGISYPTIPFESSASVTPTITSVNTSQGSGGDVVAFSGSGFGNIVSDVNVTIGGAKCAVISVGVEIICVLGPREGGAADVVVHVAGKGLSTVNVAFYYLLEATSVSPLTGSYGGGQTLTINGQGFSPSSLVTICGEICEIDTQTSTMITCFTPANTNVESESTSCEIRLTNGLDSVNVSTPYVYQLSSTPNITGVSPSSGGTAGGTRITISGKGFLSSSPLSVTVDGVVCDILGSNDTSVTCETNAHQGSLRTKVEVKVGNNGVALKDNADFFYIDRWSSRFTWGGVSLPIEQDFVVIQKGQTVLLDTHTPVLVMLLIDGGEVIFDEKNVSLSAENILITNGGRLQVGTEEEPFQSQASITMYGHLRSQELPIFGAKTLAVRNGTLDLHGKHVAHPWTKLASTAPAGAMQITLEKSVDWETGSYIVIASTGLRHSQNQNEKRRITSVSSDGMTLSLDKPLEHEHLGITENLGGVDIEFRAEVGLLTRNIVFRGSNNHAWNIPIEACPEGFNTGQFALQTCFQGRFGEEIGSDQFGGSIMVHSKYRDSQEAFARIENVEVTYAGQAFRLGRYPIHFHLMGNVSGMYVRRCAIHRTFNRAVTIHGTHNLLVDSNVVYDVMGGAIFIEDGIEIENVIQYNLAIFVRQSTSLLNDDITPAAYWVTNPNNVIQHNHAAGGTHFGFWYRMHEHPDGPSYTPTICQQKVELGVFQNNTVHSQGWFGLWIFEHYFPMLGGSCDSVIPSPARYRSLTTWNCEKGAEWVDCGAIQFIDFVMVNNEVTGIDLKLIKGTSWGEERGAMISDSLIVGHSSISETSFETPLAITLPFAPGLTINNTKFVNFNRKGTVFGLTTVQGVCVHSCGGFHYHTLGLSFESVTRKVHWRWNHEGVIVDIDGSFTGQSAYSSVVPYTGLFDTTVCQVSTGIEYSDGAIPSAICDPGVTFHRFALNQPVPSSLEGNLLYFSNDHGNSTSVYEKKRLTHPDGYMFLLQGKERYRMWFENGEQFTNITFKSKFYDFQESDYLYVGLDLKQKPDAISLNNDFHISIANATALTPSSDNLDWYYNSITRRFEFIVSGKSSARKRRAIEIVDPDYRHTSVEPSIYRCFFIDCIAPINPDQVPPARERPTNALVLSDLNNPCVERENNKITIKRSTDSITLCWVVADVNITAESITVFGVLEFDDAEDRHVTATYIVVQGGRIVAGFSEDDHFQSKLTIQLLGDHSTKELVLPGVTVGSKVIGCFGGCDFHGKPHTVHWTHLNNTAEAGTNTIVLQNEVDWEVSDEIVITTTGYRSQETEKCTIASIGADSKTLTLENNLAYRHLGESYKAGLWGYEMRAEVGLLTRNIRIIGKSYDNIISQAFGARVLVGYTSDSEGELYGFVPLSPTSTHDPLTCPCRDKRVYASTSFARSSGLSAQPRNHQMEQEVCASWMTKPKNGCSSGASQCNLGKHPLGGWGRFSNVEFFQTGQEGFTENYDPRFSLAWLNTGSPTEARPSHVTSCAFHDGFSTAIGTFGADDITIRNNVVHHTIHDGIRITGTGHKLIGNLVTLTLFRGSYHDRYEPTNYKDWQASFDLSEANQLTLIGNTAAGSERLGFHIDGEPCDASDDNAWTGNVAHGCLHGVQIFVADGVSPCSMIRNFDIYKCWDYGIYHQTSVSVVVRNTKIVDSTVGYLPLIFGPPALSHNYEDKYVEMENVLCVGRSEHFDPAIDFMDEAADDNLRNRREQPSRKAPSNPFGGKTCVMLPMFESNPNGAPFKPFHGNLNYPALHGRLSITGLHAHRYMGHSDSRDLVFFTNPDNEDAFHPTYLSGVVLTQVDNDSKIFIDRPLLSKINAADCVDMECDAKKKCLVKDLTGGFLDAPGSVLPQAEYEWGQEDRRRGLGDYRIPSTLRTATDGTLLPVDSFVDGRGILRNDACQYVDAWQAYDCHGDNVLNYEMLVIESLDSDTEIRRLSPVALLGNRYVDLNNGPQDHGWCSGYTCQLRISTFYTLVATGTTYHIFFTSTTPLKLRLHLLNVDNSKTLRVAIWYANPQRLDVERAESKLFIHSENAFYNANSEQWDFQRITSANSDSFLPPVDSAIHGANFFDRRAKLLYVTLRGDEPIDIKTAPTIIVEFGFPAVPVDNFFEVNLVENLALLMGIHLGRIKRVDVVRETNKRKRRQTSGNETATFMFEIGGVIRNTTETEDSIAETVRELNNASSVLTSTLQEGNLFSTLGVPEGTVSTTTLVIDPSDINNDTGALIQIQVPKSIRVSLASLSAYANTTFPSQPSVTVLDGDGEIVKLLGGEWLLQVSLSNTSSNTMLEGETTITLKQGKGQFADLQITHEGKFELIFELIKPNTLMLDISDRPVITITELVKPSPLEPIGPIEPIQFGRPGKPFPELPRHLHCKWTRWFDRDLPTGMGDFELFKALVIENPEELCPDPIHAQGRLAKVDHLGDDAGQDVTVDKDIGLICRNDIQKCRNYHVRFCCLKKARCINGEWTRYLSADTPDQKGDFEHLSSIRLCYPGSVCKNPSLIDARRISDQLHYSLVPERRGRIIGKKSFECRNIMPSPSSMRHRIRHLHHGSFLKCDDYEVTFCCPKREEPPCAPGDWSPWLSMDTPNDADRCDNELLGSLRSEYPEVIKCKTPTAIDARLISTEKRFDPSAPNIFSNPRIGFKCCRKFGCHCGDYEVRFCCHDAAPVSPKCDGKWTRFFDRDNPTGFGDYETLKDLRNMYENEICKKPSAVDARIVGTRTHHPISGQVATVDVETGFVCKNEDQTGSCSDYEVRFCCPEVPPNNCAQADWTKFYNIDDPVGGGNKGDIEDLFTATRLHDKICLDPTAIDVRVASTALSYTSTGQDVSISLLQGFACYNNHQKKGEICCDYEVRYCCPQGPPPACDQCTEWNGKWTRFFNVDRPSPPRLNDDCDCEFLSTIKRHYPEVCEYPIAVDVRVVSTGQDYSVAQQDVDISVIGGFRCLNSAKQQCLDYKIRFCCPEETKELGPLSWCTAFGNLHFKTFDEKNFDFQGTCTYVFSQTKDEAVRWHLHPFSILIENENRRGNTAVAYLKRVIITIGTVSIELRKGPLVLVNGRMTGIPHTDDFFGYEIFRKGANIHIHTAFGVKIIYDGNQLLDVGVPQKYENHVEGLCGNYNGDANDDLINRKTNNVTTDINAFARSYTANTTCESEPTGARPCANEDERNRTEMACRAVTAVPCLAECQNVINFEFYLQSCIFDACATEDFDRAVQHSNTAFFVACDRNDMGCAVNPNECKAGAIPTHCKSTPNCRKTCFNHNYHNLSLCETEICEPGCECGPSLVSNPAGECVPSSNCTCLADTYLTPFTCDSRCTCGDDNVPQCMPFQCDAVCFTTDDTATCQPLSG